MRDIPVPSVEGERRLPPASSRATAVLATLCISAALLTVLNLAAAMYLFRASGDLAALEGKLETLSAFEERLKGRIDLMNNGIQAQFDRLAGDLQGRMDAIDRNTQGLKAGLPGSRTDPEDWNDPVADEDLAVDSLVSAAPGSPSPQETGEGGFEPESVGPKPSGRKIAKAEPQPSAAYQRHETADGKVYYRKVH
jgi:hypothetical protein